MNRKYAESTSCVSSITACRGAVVPRFARVSAGVFTEFQVGDGMVGWSATPLDRQKSIKYGSMPN